MMKIFKKRKQQKVEIIRVAKIKMISHKIKKIPKNKVKKTMIIVP